MKWPAEVVIVRHGESTYNALKGQKENDPLYQHFKAKYKEVSDWGVLLPQDLVNLANEIGQKFSLGVSDYDTPMTAKGEEQAVQTGEDLQKFIALPDVIFVSPFLRTRQTLDFMTKGWPELARVKTYSEERIREKSPGLTGLYNDWRIFNVFHPEQKRYRDLYGELADYWYTYPNGENIPQARDRIRSWVTTLIREFAGKRVLAVTHHLTILAVRAQLERLSPEEFIRLDRQEKPVNCGVTIYRGDPAQGEDGRLVLAVYNQKLC